MASEYAIEVEGLSKEYRIYGTPYQRIREIFDRKQRHRKVWAVRDIDLQIKPGRTVGLIGENGAGKSTLLKILSGTTFPSHGRYRLNGRVASLLELGAGFHKDFSGRENIYLNAAMMGLSRDEAQERYDDILQFSELGDFIDQPIRTYSSGMICRLGFSTAIAVDPDVLVIDEILAVGDMNFQRKCVEKIWAFKDSGKTILFCSHSLYDVRQLCDEAIWVHEGRIRSHGDAVAVTNEYATFEKELIGKETDVLASLPGEPVEKAENEGPLIESAEVLSMASDEPCYQFKPGDDVRVRVHYKNATQPIPLCIGIGFTRSDTTLCFGHTSEMDGIVLDQPEGVVDLDLPSIGLLSGEFVVFVWLMDGSGVHRYHQFLTRENVVILNEGKEVGLFLQDHVWRVHDDKMGQVG